MAKIARFKLTGKQAGQSLVINSRYEFRGGIHERNEDDGKLLENILCGYYGCELEWIDDTSVSIPDTNAAPSLAKIETDAATKAEAVAKAEVNVEADVAAETAKTNAETVVKIKAK